MSELVDYSYEEPKDMSKKPETPLFDERNTYSEVWLLPIIPALLVDTKPLNRVEDIPKTTSS